MHLNIGYFVLYTPIYRLTERKQRLYVQNCPCGTVGANIGYILGLLVHGKVVVDFGRKVFLVDYLLWTNIKYGKNRIPEPAQAYENSGLNHSRKHNCVEVSKLRHSVGSSSTYPCQTRYGVGTGLRIMSRG